MISFKGVYGIKNLYLPKRCTICGKKIEGILSIDCSRCYVWHEFNLFYSIIKYIRFSIRKYLYAEKPRIISVPSKYNNLKAGDGV